MDFEYWIIMVKTEEAFGTASLLQLSGRWRLKLLLFALMIREKSKCLNSLERNGLERVYADCSSLEQYVH